MTEPFFLGIDFGARHAGTTAICFPDGNSLMVLQTKKGEDADSFCKHWLELLMPEAVMIDAPLSLPAAYFGKGGDFFYRNCDREAGAMSPLFLGGLTARAMQLADCYKQQGISFYEVYPKLAFQRLFPGIVKPSKKETFAELFEKLEGVLGFDIKTGETSAHGFDAVLAWYSGQQIFRGEAVSLGDANEGLIFY